MGCGMSMVKYILFLFNLLCAICGILIIVFGALLFSNVHINSASDIKDTIQAQQLPVALIVLGAIILLIAFFGCCGAIRESYCMTMTYSILLFILLVLQIAVVVYAFVAKEDFLKDLAKGVDLAWEKSNNNGKADYMDGLQVTFKCCGRDGPQDYIRNVIFGGFPKTCCPVGTESCSVLSAYGRGCKDAFVDWYSSNWKIFKIGAIIVGAIELSGLLMVGLGALVIAALSKTDDVQIEYAYCIALIVLGSIIFIIAFFGCCGAIRESFCMSITYMILLLLLLLLQIGVILSVYANEKDLEVGSRKLVSSAWKNRIEDPENMDQLQNDFKCCGNESPNDYRVFGFGGYFPKSCCDDLQTKNGTIICTERTMYRVSCQHAHIEYLKKNWENVKYGCIGVAVIEGAGIFAAGCLINNIRNIRRRRRY